MKNIIKTALANSLATTAYVSGVASFLFYAGQAKLGRNNIVLIPIIMLLLLVLSASICGFLIFGRPILLYFDGKKKQALSLLGYTLGFLFLIVLAAIFSLVISTK
jgi:hypothetical protein